MLIFSLPIKFLIALILGAVIGLERESQEEKKEQPSKFDVGSLGGLRTFSLISLLGALAGFLSLGNNSVLFIIISVAFLTMLCLYYVIDGILMKSTGLTTEIAALFTFLIGFFVTSEILPIQLTLALTVVLVLILSLKEKTKVFALGIKRQEIKAFIAFAVVAMVILPFLPNQAYYITDIPGIKTIFSAYHIQLGLLEQLEILNPFKLWFIVALITGIDIFGYLLSKFFGRRGGILLSSLVGGFISSTSTTQSLAQQSKKITFVNQLVAAAIFANLASFLQIFVLIAPLNSQWLVLITPIILLMVLVALAAGFFYLLTKKTKWGNKKILEKFQTKKKKKKFFLLAQP